MNPASNYTLSPGFAALLVDLGIEATAVLRRAGLPDDLFTQGTIQLPPSRYFALWRALAEEADDPTLPVRIGRAISVEFFEPSLFAALCSPNLHVAARRIARYKPLIGPLRLLVAESSTETTLEFVWPDGEAPPEVLATTELVFWVAFTRLATRARVNPLRAGCPSPPSPVFRDSYHEYFGVDIREGPRYSVTFSARCCPPLPHGQRAHVAVLRARAQTTAVRAQRRRLYDRAGDSRPP